MPKPRILIPEPTSFDAAYNQRGWPQYAAAVAQAGGEPVCVPLHTSQEEQARLIASAQAILLPGSHADVNPEKFGETAAPQTAPADSLREAADELLLQDAFNLRKPIFGICYGMQSMNVWRGGSLVQHLETETNHSPGREVAQAHRLRITPGSRLATLIEAAQPQAPVLVNSSHHQAVGRVGDQFVAVAESPEDGTIEAIEAIDPPLPAAEPAFIVGVQWHPERTVATSPVSRALFRAFVEAAGAWKLQPNGNVSPR
jgi:putative glutamine amidotransferase